MYHVTRIHLYGGFYRAEKGEGMAVEHIIELVSHKTIHSSALLHQGKLPAADDCAHCF